jgi:hypothetical protein
VSEISVNQLSLSAKYSSTYLIVIDCLITILPLSFEGFPYCGALEQCAGDEGSDVRDIGEEIWVTLQSNIN